MQVVNEGTAELAGDAFLTSINSLMGSITALIIAVSGIVIAIITQRSQGRAKTRTEENAIGAAESLQLVMQKLAENEARISSVGKATLSLATTEEQREALDRDVAPVIKTTKERIDVINQQTSAIKELLGVKAADINARKELPRESDATLDVVNETVQKAKSRI